MLSCSSYEILFARKLIDLSVYRLVQILDSLFDTPVEEERSLHRSESEESMASALSSFANTG